MIHNLEEIVFEDVREWVEANLLDGETWDEYFNKLQPKDYQEKVCDFLDIYWKDHIFPIEKYLDDK